MDELVAWTLYACWHDTPDQTIDPEWFRVTIERIRSTPPTALHKDLHADIEEFREQFMAPN